MSRNLGPGTPVAPATRAGRSGWRDPRLWIGVVLVAASVVLGARLLAAADDTVAVWTFVEDQGTGSEVSADRLVTTRVRFDDPAELDLYLRADESVPEGMVLRRDVGAGELLARSAIGPAADLGVQHVPLEVEPNRMPTGIDTGAVIDVYVDDRARRGTPAGLDESGLALERVTVVDAPAAGETFAVGGNRLLVVAVDADRVAGFQTLLNAMDEPVLAVTEHAS